ncbi:MAG: branched-subunit amino acid transport protein AzlD [Sulfurimonas sp.]|jgi:branched-subunit amino acid transport protein AzlD
MQNNEIYLAILIMAGVNYFTRVFPFIFFRKKEPSKIIVYIETYFPPVIMSILIIYSLKDINFLVMPYGLKEIGAVFFTALLHLKFNNYLVSIFSGTVFYMFLVQYF